MIVNREGENGALPFRTGRFFNVGTKWYFSTRESMDQGPYPDKKEAEYALNRYIENCMSVGKIWS